MTARRHLLDTTMFSDLMREHPVVEQHLLAARNAGGACVGVIVQGETRYGLERLPRGRRRRDLEAKAERLFAALPCEPIPAAAGDIYGRIRRTAEAKGLRLDDNDLWITATALALGAILVTRDSDLRRVAGLEVEDWTQP